MDHIFGAETHVTQTLQAKRWPKMFNIFIIFYLIAGVWAGIIGTGLRVILWSLNFNLKENGSNLLNLLYHSDAYFNSKSLKTAVNIDIFFSS